MSKATARAERLREMERLYFQRAWSDIEMAERLGVDRITVWRDRRDLIDEVGVVIIPDDEGRWYVDRTQYLSQIRVNFAEALSLYLAARRASQQTRIAQADVAKALGKLAVALRRPMTERLVKAADQILLQKADPTRTDTFKTIAQAWIENRTLRLHYRALGAEVVKVHRFDPYLLEPSPWTDGVYLVGRSELSNKVITLKLERVEKAVPLGPFTPPADFDEQAMLRHAWGIWGSDAPPVTVRLRFAPGLAARRLKESVWHPLETVTDTPDGGCLWEAEIAEWREMLPWVRGWGADVEVLAPEGMRRAVSATARRMAELYGVAEVQPIPPYQLLWAKTGPLATTHPLICHLIDVGQVALALWQYALTDAARKHIGGILDLPTDECGRLLAFWAALHDLGKASPSFQRKYEAAIASLTRAGFIFSDVPVNEPVGHATVTATTLAEVLVEVTGLPKRIARRVAQTLGGHHGLWPTGQMVGAVKTIQYGGDGAWRAARRELVEALYAVFQPPPVQELGDGEEAENSILMFLSGLTTVADWIGSMAERFPFVEAPLAADEYAAQAAAQARAALDELGWLAWQPESSPARFADLFDLPAPNAVQACVAGLAPTLDRPSLVIVETPTGSGKTEAALYLADYWNAVLQQRGIYVAMPTMATSNQMHGRVGRYLHKRYPALTIEPLLLHAQAQWRRDEPPPDIQTQDEQGGQVQDQGWFLPRKKSLLAPFGVGTVDQALLSVLQARHFFVRLWGLAGKTVIFDEVHAYDTYMTTLFQRLLAWLQAQGASVILLSATLPNQTRRELVEAYAGKGAGPLPACAYPSLTVANERGVAAYPIQWNEERAVALHWIARSPAAIVELLRERLAEGGCAAVICNTVRRAQEVYRALRDTALVAPDDLTLFHARYPMAWRNEIEEKVLARFGKEASERPQRAVVVATQVIEQSLDLDFDVMVSDLAPVDLLIQRAGRLHRHERNGRPERLRTPALWVAVDADAGDLPTFGTDTWVYERYVLLRSYWALRGRAGWSSPGDISPLIESVYGPALAHDHLSPQAARDLEAARREFEMRNAVDIDKAERRLIRKPHEKRLLELSGVELHEDSPDIHAALQALTRLGPPSLDAVCLFNMPGGLNTIPDGSGAMVNLAEAPDAELTFQLIQTSVGVNHGGLVSYLQQHGDVPDGWRKHSLLRNRFALVFDGNVCRLPGLAYILRLSHEFGLEIQKEDA